MNTITRITANLVAPKGRERICVQCGTIYKSQRSTSTYCSTSCRKKGHRGTPPTNLKPEQWAHITKAVYKLGLIGITSKVPLTYALTVSVDHAYGDLAYHLERRELRHISIEEFRKALRIDGILSFDTLSPEATGTKLWRDRNTRRLERQS